MVTSHVRAALLATTIIAGAGSAFAQEAAPASDIVVTGSRVARPNAESPSPITTVGATDIKEFGATKIEDLTNSLPQVFAGQDSSVSNGADGTATIDLRGLGASRTLVLIDGKRLMPGGVGGGAGADLNFIPAALVSSVDLLTGGASAAYGADAVAGVVNFKMDRKFEGIRIDAQYGFYQHNNDNSIRSIVNQRFRAPEGNTVHGGAWDATIALGTGVSDGRGHIVAYGGYRKESAVTQDLYDYTYCTLNEAGASVACGGSGTPALTRFGALPNRPGSFTLTSGGITPYVALRDAYNFAPLNYLRRPSERFVAGAFAEYEINESIRPYVDLMFMDYSTQAQIAPSGAFYGPRTVNCNNPLLLRNTALAAAACGADAGTPTTVDILIGKRNVEGGARFNDIGFNQFRIVTGLKGDLNKAWSYDAYFQIGQIKVANTYRNDVSDARINRALNVVNVNGVPTCQSVVDGTDPNCVPYDVFNLNGVTSAAANYINIPLVLTGTTRETVAAAQLSGNLGEYGIRSPFAEDGLRVSLGVEYRTEDLKTQPDLSYINGDGAGQGGPTLPIDGHYSVTDFFAEAGLPLVTDKPFFHDLSLELGFRHSKYNVRGAATQNEADTYKIAGNWSPVPWFTLRGSYNRAVRSPNIGELFTAQQIGLFSGSDPCVGPAVNGLVNGFTAAQCARTGVTAAQFGNLVENTAEQYNQFIGGLLTLKPEVADSYSVGFTVQPKEGFLRGFFASADWYDIKVKQAIGGIGAQVILDQCIATGDPFFCGKIRRAPGNGPDAGSLWLGENGFVDNRVTNTGSLRTQGIDINADYRTSIGDHRLRWSFVGVILNKYIAQPLTGGFDYNCAGFYGSTCGLPAPKFRFNTNVKWTLPNDFAMTVRWRYLGPVLVDGASSDPDLAGAVPAFDRRIRPYSYFDILAAVPIKEKMTFRVGVNNIFDKDPPIISQSSAPANGNTFPGTYDARGRYIFVNLTADF